MSAETKSKRVVKQEAWDKATAAILKALNCPKCRKKQTRLILSDGYLACEDPSHGEEVAASSIPGLYGHLAAFYSSHKNAVSSRCSMVVRPDDLTPEDVRKLFRRVRSESFASVDATKRMRREWERYHELQRINKLITCPKCGKDCIGTFSGLVCPEACGGIRSWGHDLDAAEIRKHRGDIFTEYAAPARHPADIHHATERAKRSRGR